MLKRTITGVVAFLAILPCLIFSDTYAFVGLLQIAAAISGWELLGCIGLRKHPTLLIPTVLFLFGMPLFARYAIRESRDALAVLAIGSFLYLFWLLTFSVFSKGRFKVPDVSCLFGLSLYVLFGIYSLILLRDEDCGAYLYLFPFFTAWGSDIFAYFTGRAFGRHKLIPEVSPKKTVEGAVGGVLCCTLVVLVYGFAVGKIFGVTPYYLHLALAGFVMSMASMIGDLIMSYVKRHYGIKDFGRILPGHGGILDRIDSVLVTAPFLLILYTLFPSFALFTA